MPKNAEFSIKTEAEMLALGEKIGSALASQSFVFELLGDVGAGKTTLTRGLAAGLGVAEPVTSPSFTISKQYAFPPNQNFPTGGRLIHYDFYRLPDPGLMSDDLAEAISDPQNVVVIEWGGDVADLLPESHTTIKIALQPDGSRQVKIS